MNPNRRDIRKAWFLFWIAWALVSGAGETASISYAGEIPRRIISLGPALTESLFLLGAGDRVVGVTTYCRRPPEARQKDKVGTILEINIEEVVIRNPDLVVATNLNQRASIEKLQGLGVRVVEFPLVENFERLCQQFLRLGKLVGREREARKIINTAKLQVNDVREAVRDLPRPKVFVQVGAKPLFAATREYFIHDFIMLAGGTNITEDAGTGLYSREKVIAADPDIIIITTMGIAGEKERSRWQRHKSLKAVQFGRIYIVDPDTYCTPTPLSFAEALEEMAGILHPGLKGK